MPEHDSGKTGDSGTGIQEICRWAVYRGDKVAHGTATAGSPKEPVCLAARALDKTNSKGLLRCLPATGRSQVFLLQVVSHQHPRDTRMFG
jgi:hypothetical protein